MTDFIEYDPYDGKVPTTSGAYNIVIISRDGVPVISVAYYDSNSKNWYRQYIQEYGYAFQNKMEDNIISYFKGIDGVEFKVIPESYEITISGVKDMEE